MLNHPHKRRADISCSSSSPHPPLIYLITHGAVVLAMLFRSSTRRVTVGLRATRMSRSVGGGGKNTKSQSEGVQVIIITRNWFAVNRSRSEFSCYLCNLQLDGRTAPHQHHCHLPEGGRVVVGGGVQIPLKRKLFDRILLCCPVTWSDVPQAGGQAGCATLCSIGKLEIPTRSRSSGERGIRCGV